MGSVTGWLEERDNDVNHMLAFTISVRLSTNGSFIDRDVRRLSFGGVMFIPPVGFRRPEAVLGACGGQTPCGDSNLMNKIYMSILDDTLCCCLQQVNLQGLK